jgi:CRISPR-associated endoribonuclease Cas6
MSFMEPDMSQPHEPHEASDTLHTIAIQLQAGDRGVLPIALNHAIHTQVMTWLSVGDSDLAETIRKMQEKPLSISGLLSYRDRHSVEAGDELTIRIGLLNGRLMQPLLAGLERWENEPIRLGQFLFVLKGVYSMPDSYPSVRSSQYQILARMPRSSDDLTLQFLFPTSFKQKQFIQPFPLADCVFSSLLRRWNHFAPESVRFSKVDWEGVVSAYDLKTHALKMEGAAEIGCQGWARYRFSNHEQARIATILANFAFYAGVGRKTAMGMGQACIGEYELLMQNKYPSKRTYSFHS